VISQQTIQQIIARTDVIDIIGSFVKLKKRGTIISVFVPFTMKKALHLPYRLQKKFISALGAEEAATP
jgi:DNA primase